MYLRKYTEFGQKNIEKSFELNLEGWSGEDGMWQQSSLLALLRVTDKIGYNIKLDKSMINSFIMQCLMCTKHFNR